MIVMTITDTLNLLPLRVSCARCAVHVHIDVQRVYTQCVFKISVAINFVMHVTKADTSPTFIVI